MKRASIPLLDGLSGRSIGPRGIGERPNRTTGPGECPGLGRCGSSQRGRYSAASLRVAIVMKRWDGVPGRRRKRIRRKASICSTTGWNVSATPCPQAALPRYQREPSFSARFGLGGWSRALQSASQSAVDSVCCPCVLRACFPAPRRPVNREDRFTYPGPSRTPPAP